MSKPICEELTTRPSPQPGYLEIGELSADGRIFTPVSVVGESLPRESQLYFVAAEGRCTIRGQDKVGQVAANPVPGVEPASPVPAVAPPELPAPTGQQPPDMVAPDWAVWGMAALVVFGAIASAITVHQSKGKGKVPAKTQSIQLGGNGDGL